MTSTSTLQPPPQRPTASLPKATANSATTSSHRIVQKRWVCDVCHVKWFLDFDEACRHEAACQSTPPRHDHEETKASATSVISQEHHDAIHNTNSSPVEIIHVESSDDSSKSARTNQLERRRRSERVRRPPPPTPVNETRRTPAKRDASSNDISKKSKRHPGAAIPAFFHPPKTKTSNAPSSGIVSQEDYAQHILAERLLQKKRRKKVDAKESRKLQRADDAHGATDAPPISDPTTRENPVLPQNVLAEHAAASFFARRKQAAKEERERQKKREEARRSTKRREEDKSSCGGEDKRSGGMGRGEAVRFPCPSHVLPKDDVAETLCNNEGGMSPKYPHGRVDLTLPFPEEPTTARIFFDSDCHRTHTQDLTLRLFSSVFGPSAPLSNDSRLWTDKHTLSQIPSSVLGASNQESSQKLMRFIEEWKSRRHKSTLLKRSKKRKSGYDSDDSFLDGESSSPTSLFVITGQTGTGKSRLVHAVAAGLDCALLEISTGEVRGGAALKKRVMESTLSHSSVALMKRRERVTVLTGGGKKEFFDEESESEEEEEERRSLTVILIDEVDLLFQDDGDTGFWLALSQLSQKAKSPIVLTATSIPPELISRAMKFEHIELHRPSVEECCSKMKEVAKAEGMVLQPDAGDTKGRSVGLSLIAEYFQCDIRKILNEMQLFHVSTTNQSCSTDVVVYPRDTKAKSLGCIVGANAEEKPDRPVILNIDPLLIPRDRPTLITIEGKNFQRTDSATLYFGGKICRHFRVVSDSKILAVCPPLFVPDGVSSGLRYKNSAYGHTINCLSSKFVDVVVRKRCSNGLVLDSTSCLPPHRSKWNIEYDVSLECSLLEQKLARKEFIRKAKAQRKRLENAAEDGFFSSEEELELEGDTSNSTCINDMVEDDLSSDVELEKSHLDSEVSDSNPMQDVDPQVLLNEALSELTVQISSKECIDKTDYHNVSSTLNEWHTFAEDLGRLSDVALLEDALLGIPMLAGGVEGVGTQAMDGIFVDSIHVDPSIDKLCKEKKKPPSFEALYTSGLSENGLFFGDVDAYMTYPCRQRDRSLLSNTELYSRGLGVLEHVIEQEPVDSEASESTHDELEASNLELIPPRIQSEDDMFISHQPPATLLLLHALLGNLTQDTVVLHRAICENEPWLHLRRHEMSSKVLDIMSTILVPESSAIEHDWNKICFGFRHSERFTTEMAQQSRLRICNWSFDHNLALDYLPYLRFIARKENETRLASEEIMNVIDKGTRHSRTSTRRKQHLRPHYLEEFCGKYCDLRRLRRDLAELGDSYLLEY